LLWASRRPPRPAGWASIPAGIAKTVAALITHGRAKRRYRRGGPGVQLPAGRRPTGQPAACWSCGSWRESGRKRRRRRRSHRSMGSTRTPDRLLDALAPAADRPRVARLRGAVAPDVAVEIGEK
jgi:hypothetical protein